MKMKLVDIYRSTLREDDLHRVTMMQPNSPSVDQEADEESKVILLIQKLETNPEFIQALREITLLSSKYKALQKFAQLMGIPTENFQQVMQQAQIQSTIPNNQ